MSLYVCIPAEISHNEEKRQPRDVSIGYIQQIILLLQYISTVIISIIIRGMS